MKPNIPMIADLLFYTLSAWLFSLCLLRYYRVTLWLALTAASLITLAVALAVLLLLCRSRRKKLLGKREREARDAILLHLALEKPERVRAALQSAYLADGKTAVPAEEGLCLDGKTAIPLFTLEAAGADEIARLIRRHGREFTLLCNALTPEAEKLIASFGIAAVYGDEIYALFTRTGTVPDPLICGELPRKNLRLKVRRAFSKSNARPFFVSGILLLIMSLFTIFPLYYIISGAILLMCAVTVRLFGYAA